MASSKVARRRQGSLPKEPPASVDISDSDGEKDSGLDDFEIIKTIGESSWQVLSVQSVCIRYSVLNASSGKNELGRERMH